MILTLFWTSKIKKYLSKNKEKKTATHFKSVIEEKEINKNILKIKDASKIKSANELQYFLQSYACQNWGTPKNASLETIFATAKKQCPALSQKDINYIINSLHDTMYAEKEIDLENVKKHCMDLMLVIKKKEIKRADKSKKLPDLNPT